MQQEIQWYVWYEEVVCGPFDLQKMRQLINKGKFCGSAQVRIGESGDWRPLDSFPELALFLSSKEATFSVKSSDHGSEISPVSPGSTVSPGSKAVEPGSTAVERGSVPVPPPVPREKTFRQSNESPERSLPGAFPSDSEQTENGAGESGQLTDPFSLESSGFDLSGLPETGAPVFLSNVPRKRFWRRHRKAFYWLIALGVFVVCFLILLSTFWKDPLIKLQRRALQGDYFVQLELGELFWRGGEVRSGIRRRSVPVNLSEAFEYNRMAAQTRQGEPMYRVATMYSEGLGTGKNPEMAKDYFEGAFADKKLEKYALRLDEYALRCIEGKGVPQNIQRGLEIWDELFDKWPVKRQWLFASQLADGNYGKDYANLGKKYFDRILENPKNVDKYALEYALRLAQGNGTQKNESEALLLLNRGQKVWKPDTIWEVGLRLGKGDFGDSNKKWAITWLELAAEKDSARLYELYEALDKGLVSEPDHEKAMSILAQAVKEGQERAIKEWERIQELLRQKRSEERQEEKSAPTNVAEVGVDRFAPTEVAQYLEKFPQYEYGAYSLDECQTLTRLWRVEKNQAALLRWLHDEVYANRIVGIIDACAANGSYRLASRWSALGGEIYKMAALKELAELLDLFPKQDEINSPSVFVWEKKLKLKAGEGRWEYSFVLSILYRARYLYWSDSSHSESSSDQEKNRERAKNKAIQVRKNSGASYRKYRDLYMEQKPDPLWLTVPLLGD